MKIRLRGNLQEQKIQCVSARGPQLRAGRKMAAVLIHQNHFLLKTLVKSPSCTKIWPNLQSVISINQYSK